MEAIEKKYKGFDIVAFWMQQDGFCAYLIYKLKDLVFYEFNYWDGEMKNAKQAYEKAKQYVINSATPS